MGQVRYARATTTHAVRAATQRSQASIARLSREPGIIPKTTTYSGGPEDFISTPLQQMVDAAESGTFAPPTGRTFVTGDIAKAQRVMESNSAGGKIVVTT